MKITKEMTLTQRLEALANSRPSSRKYQQIVDGQIVTWYAPVLAGIALGNKDGIIKCDTEALALLRAGEFKQKAIDILAEADAQAPA